MRMKLVRTQHPEQANTMFELNCKTGITPDQMNEESVTNSPAMMTVMLAAAARSGRFYCQEMMELLKELPVKRFNEKTLDPILAKNVQDLRDAEVRYLQHRQTIMLTELLEKTRAKMIIKRKKVRDEREKKKKAQLKKKTQEKARKERKAQKKAAKEQEELKQRKEEREQNLREKAAVADPETANQEPVAIKSEKQETIVVQDEQKKEEEVEEDEEECCICLDDIADDEKWTSVNACMHCFHMSCISEWKAQCRSKELEPTCPLCRQTL